jgi:hypothetical protein
LVALWPLPKWLRTDRQTDRQADMQTCRSIYKSERTDRRTGRHADMQTGNLLMHTCIHAENNLHVCLSVFLSVRSHFGRGFIFSSRLHAQPAVRTSNVVHRLACCSACWWLTKEIEGCRDCAPHRESLSCVGNVHGSLTTMRPCKPCHDKHLFHYHLYPYVLLSCVV